MAVTSISIVCTVWVLKLHHCCPHVRPVPTWLRWVIPRKQSSPDDRTAVLWAERQTCSGPVSLVRFYSKLYMFYSSCGRTFVPVLDLKIADGCKAVGWLNNDRIPRGTHRITVLWADRRVLAAWVWCPTGAATFQFPATSGQSDTPTLSRSPGRCGRPGRGSSCGS